MRNAYQHDLAQADGHIARAMASFHHQQVIIAELSRKGAATQEAARALATMRDIVEAMRWHRQRIATQVAQE